MLQLMKPWHVQGGHVRCRAAALAYPASLPVNQAVNQNYCHVQGGHVHIVLLHVLLC